MQISQFVLYHGSDTKVKRRKATFAEIAPLIHYDKYNSYQVAFCTDKALQLLTYLDK